MSDYFHNLPYMGNSNMGFNGMNNSMGNMGFQFSDPSKPQWDRLQQLTQQYNNNNIQQNQNVTNSNVNWVYVDGISNAKNQIVRPGYVLWMRNNDNTQIYAKTVTDSGFVKFEPYYLVPITEENINVNSNGQVNIQQNTMNQNDNFVPIERFNKLEEDFNNLQTKVSTYESFLTIGNAKEETTNKTTSKRGGTNNESK